MTCLEFEKKKNFFDSCRGGQKSCVKKKNPLYHPTTKFSTFTTRRRGWYRFNQWILLSRLLKQLIQPLLLHSFLWMITLKTHTHTHQKKRRQSYLNTSPILLPYLPTLLLKFVCLLFRMDDPLVLVFVGCSSSSSNRGLEIAFEPRIETSVVCLLERCTLGSEALRHRRCQR